MVTGFRACLKACLIVSGILVPAGLTAQDIHVSAARNVTIVDGSTEPSGFNHTDLGEISVVGSSIGVQIKITNTDTVTNLQITGPVTVTGSGAAHFSVSQPTSPVSPGATVNFNLTFNPDSEGEHVATITIPSNDPDTEASYTFDVRGVGGDNPDDGPNLEVTSEVPPDITARKNGEFQLKWSVRVGNESTTKAVGKSQIKFVLSDDQFLDPTDPVVKVRSLGAFRALKEEFGDPKTKRKTLKVNLGTVFGGHIFAVAELAPENGRDSSFVNNVVAEFFSFN